MKRILLIILCLTMLMSCGSLYVFADEDISYPQLESAYITNDSPVINEDLNVAVYYNETEYSKLLADEDRDWISYQWYRNVEHSNTNGTPIYGADGIKYNIRNNDMGYYIYCVISCANNTIVTLPTYNAVSESGTIAGIKINNSLDPRIGEELKAEICNEYKYSFTNSDTELIGRIFDTKNIKYQWYRNTVQSNSGGTAIDGAVSASYTPTWEDFGQYLYLEAKGIGNRSGSAVSNVTNHPVCAAYKDGITTSNDPINIQSVTICGTPETGSCVYAYINDGLRTDGHCSFRWYISDEPDNNGVLINGAASQIYKIDREYSGKYLYAEVNGIASQPVMITNEHTEIESITLNRSSEAMRNNDMSVEIIPENANVSLVWYRNNEQTTDGGEAIPGAVFESYTCASNDVGKYVYCKATDNITGKTVSTVISDRIKNQYVITYYPDGNFVDPLYCTDVSDGADVSEAIPEISSLKYEFLGWATTENANTPDVVKGYTLTKDMILYPVWGTEKSAGFDVKVESENVFVTLVGLPQNGVLVGAFYDKNGICISHEYKNTFMHKTDYNFDIPTNSVYARVYLWDDLVSMQPLCNAQEISIE